MKRETLTAAREIDWDREAPWYQDQSLYLVEDMAGDGISVQMMLRDQSGNRFETDRAAFERTHLPLCDARVFKPRYAPLQAICLPDDCRLRIGEDAAEIEVPAGDAVLRHGDGRIAVMARHQFNCRYRFVGAASPVAP